VGTPSPRCYSLLLILLVPIRENFILTLNRRSMCNASSNHCHCWHPVYGKDGLIDRLSAELERCCFCGETRDRWITVIDGAFDAADVAVSGPWDDYDV
jgi:hypothetical protein